jgi:hypothetical protein
MPDDSLLTTYCGLYCGDCIPSKKELFAAAAHLQKLLAALQFEKYAELKAGQTYWSQSNSAFRQYPQFLEVLQAIRELECTSTCREGGGWKGGRCAVRNCAMEKGLAGCWECAEYKSCPNLEPLLRFHPNLAYHLELIRSEGVENWASGRKGHYPWSD